MPVKTLPYLAVGNNGHGIKNITCKQTMRVENTTSDAFTDAKVNSASEPAMFFFTYAHVKKQT